MPAAIDREFVADVHSPAAARSFVKEAVGALLSTPVPPSLCDDVELVVSELVTNAVRAGSTRLRIVVTLRSGRVVLHVGDDAAGTPRPRQPTVDGVGGRGLPLVGALTVDWGVRPADLGKIVWAEILIPGGA